MLYLYKHVILKRNNGDLKYMSTELYDRKQLDKAQTLSIVALLGILLPIAGIVLALLAAGIVSNIEATDNKTTQRKTSIIATAILGIVVSFGGGYLWYASLGH